MATSILTTAPLDAPAPLVEFLPCFCSCDCERERPTPNSSLFRWMRNHARCHCCAQPGHITKFPTKPPPLSTDEAPPVVHGRSINARYTPSPEEALPNFATRLFAQ